MYRDCISAWRVDDAMHVVLLLVKHADLGPMLISPCAHERPMAPQKEPRPPLAAPGIGGANSILNPPMSGPRSSRRHRNRSFSHAHLEVDLAPSPPPSDPDPLFARLAGFLKEREIVEKGTLILLAAAALHAVAARRFRRVDHWEISPGGALPPPAPGKDPDEGEPVGDLLGVLESESSSLVASARKFSAGLSDLSGNHVDFVLRRVHRERRHALSIDLRGSWTLVSVNELKGALSSRLPVVHSSITKFQYA